MDTIYIGALDIGGTKIAASVADAKGPLARVVERTVKCGTPRALGELAVALLEKACEQAGVEHKLLDRVGVSSCGPFVRVNGMIGLTTPNICGGNAQRTDLPNNWEVIPLEEVLRERFSNVVIENDCVAALVGERTFGAVQDEPNCVYVTWSTGIGFGLCVDGHVLRGKQGNAGHAGHLLMSEISSAVCGCGNRGDLEALISGRNIGVPLNMSAEELFKSAQAGNPQAREAVLAAATWFGRGLYNVAAMLDTSKFVVGGSVWTAHGGWMLPTVSHEIESRLPALTRGVSIVSAGLGSFVADVGALSLVIPAEWIPLWRKSEPWRALAALADKPQVA